MLDQVAEEHKINVENTPLKILEDFTGYQKVLNVQFSKDNDCIVYLVS